MGYVAALLIGLSLGLIGGGGSILTVPVLVYLFGVSPITATSYSLFIVGSTSVVGSMNSFRHGWVSLKTVLLFGLPSIITVFLIRRYLLGMIPASFDIGGYQVSLSVITMIAFALLMLLSAISMIRSKDADAVIDNVPPGYSRLLLYGIGVGVVTGLLGAGGGFLLIPALVLGIRLSIKTAVGTSLVIISLNSITGFLADIGHFEIQWKLLLILTIIAISGVLAGGRLAGTIRSERLKKIFGWFVLLVGVAIIFQELWALL